MTVLAMDSSTSACSAALWNEGAVMAHRLRIMARGQSEVLIPLVREVMDEAGLEFARLSLLAVTVGPGAFTGIRIGLAAARGLALATGLPLAGIATTQAVAAGIPAEERQGRTILTALDSRRAELWLQPFDEALCPLGPVLALEPEQAGRLELPSPPLVVGDAAALIMPYLPGAEAASAPGWPDAARVAELAERAWPLGHAMAPEPLYLRPPDVSA